MAEAELGLSNARYAAVSDRSLGSRSPSFSPQAVPFLSWVTQQSSEGRAITDGQSRGVAMCLQLKGLLHAARLRGLCAQRPPVPPEALMYPPALALLVALARHIRPAEPPLEGNNTRRLWGGN